MVSVSTIAKSAACWAVLCPLALASQAPGPVAGPSPTATAIHQDLLVPNGSPESLELEVVLGGELHTLVLEKRSFRSLRFRRATLEHGVEAPHPVRTYRGTVKGWDDSLVAATLTADGLEAMVLGGPRQEGYLVDPGWTRPSERGIRHAVTRLENRSPAGLEPLSRQLADELGLPKYGSSAVVVGELAFDADYQFYLEAGSTEAGTVAAVEGLMNRVNAVLEYYFGFVFELVEYVIRDQPGPYGSPTTTFGLLAVLNQEWCLETSPYWDVHRDLVHLFTGRDFGGQYSGFARNNICSRVGRSVSLDRDWPRYQIVLHELAHNLGGCHCNDPDSICPQDPDCGVMCNPACGPVTWTFGPENQTRIADRIAAAVSLGCLTTTTASSPPSFLVSPHQVEVIGGATAQLVGSNLTQVLTIDWGGTVIDLFEFTLVDDSTIELTVPPGGFLGTGTVTTDGAGGQSSATFEYVECAPQVVDQPGAIYTDQFNDSYRWTYCGPVGAHVKLLFSRSSAVALQNGVEVLVNPSVLTEHDLLPPDASPIGTAVYPPLTEPAWSFEHPTAACSSFFLQLVVYENGVPVESSPLSCNFIRDLLWPNRCNDQNPCD